MTAVMHDTFEGHCHISIYRQQIYFQITFPTVSESLFCAMNHQGNILGPCRRGTWQDEIIDLSGKRSKLGINPNQPRTPKDTLQKPKPKKKRETTKRYYKSPIEYDEHKGKRSNTQVREKMEVMRKRENNQGWEDKTETGNNKQEPKTHERNTGSELQSQCHAGN